MFPRLFEEMQTDEEVVDTLIEIDVSPQKKSQFKRFDRYNPDILDFIRRCDNEQQAEEIIQYLEERREISSKYAKNLRKQIRESGVRSLGPKKEDDYYSRRGEI